MKKFEKLFLTLGLFLPALLGTGCESEMAMESKMDEIAGDYVLVQPVGHDIPHDEYEAMKVASIRKAGNGWVLDYVFPIISYNAMGGGYNYSFRRFCQDIYYNQVLGTYIVSPLYADDVEGSGLKIWDMGPVQITAKALSVGNRLWIKQ